MPMKLFTDSVWPQYLSFLNPLYVPMSSFNSSPSPFFHHSSTTTTASAAASKRKLDDIFDDPFSSSVTSRMRKDQSTLPSYNSQPKLSSETCLHQDSLPSSSSSLASASESTPRVETRLVQFFVRGFSNRTLVFVADRNDVVYKVHERILAITKIPICEQRLIYNGKQLQWEKTLAECGLSGDANLQLVGRMRSTDHPEAWQLLNYMVGLISHFCRAGPNANRRSCCIGSYGLVSESNNSVIKVLISKFLSMARHHNDTEKSIGHLKIFQTTLAPLALVTLYRSVFSGNRGIAMEAIKHFITSSRTTLSKATHRYCAPIVLEFCKLLGSGVGTSDPLYIFCRNSLGSMVEDTSGGSCDVEDLIDVQDYLQFIYELAGKLSDEVVLRMGPEPSGEMSSDDIHDLNVFLYAVRNCIIHKLGARSQVGLTFPRGKDSDCYNATHYPGQIEFLHWVFSTLLGRMNWCLQKIETRLGLMEKENLEQMSARWDQYLAFLKELNSISKLFEGGEKKYWETLGQRKVSLCYLIVKFAKRTDDHKWILVHKEVTNFETRRHLVMMMFNDMKDEYDELHEMLIDRSQLLEESFSYIGRAEPESLHGGIFMEFKNEEATGLGVLREWFFLVCQAIFNPQNALFVACPNDRRRFFPNPASKVDPLHLEYFCFSGRIIALALMHKIQVGIVFDRVFIVQLAGKNVSLEDICDADPYLYNSCKAILEMDPDIVDEDALGLTFVREVYELGTRKVVELCFNGKNITVTSKNRKEYVSLLVQHSFVTSIAEQVAHFTRGFADIMNGVDTKARALLQKCFFESIDLEDFDLMLHGSESAICVDSWMAHTKYNGFKETDPQIRWFWKIVGKMSAEQRKILLFFWTSIKFLSVEGFCGLGSPLYIYRTLEPPNHLPSSHTCFYRLCFPAYPSKKIMQERLHLITQEHVGCSFGTW